MKIIIDCNRIIAALMKDSTTRKIIFNKNFEFFAPEYIKTELEKYSKEIIDRTEVSKEEFDILISMIFENINILSKEDYSAYIDTLKTEISDDNDLPYLAACIQINAEAIWTHDPHFKNQKKCKIYTNIDMLNFTRET